MKNTFAYVYVERNYKFFNYFVIIFYYNESFSNVLVALLLLLYSGTVYNTVKSGCILL
jgi:hypothetical protein